MSQFYPLPIACCKQETRDAMVVTFEVPAGLEDRFRFVQGQHLTLRAMVEGEELRRSYSICSAPFEDALRIAIKRAPGGIFSNWAHQNFKPGLVIDCLEPAGHFHLPLDPAAARHHVAFAAGSGITPVISIIKTTLAGEPQSHVTLVYGNRSSSSVLFREELSDLKDRYTARFNLLYLLSREHQEIELFNGRIDRSRCDHLLTGWIDPSTIDAAYICGPRAMMEEVSESLVSHHVERSRILIELFSENLGPRRRQPSAAAGAHPQVSRITVIQEGRRREFSIDRSPNQQTGLPRTLLDAALEQGIELPYSCKGGVCSTCRSKLIRGEVEMDTHYALEDYEIARGFVLPCQSYALTDEIVLDYDQQS